MLQNIFDSITPENIKDIPLIRDSMEIFIETINEKNNISVDISNIFSEEHKVIREEFIKIYLDDLYRYFTAAKSNKLISEKIAKNNAIEANQYMNPDFIGDLTDVFTDEHFIISKAFKQKKGTKVGIEYIYNIVEALLYDAEHRGNFKLTAHKEGEPIVPFVFEVEGSLYKEIYNEIVKPLAHPLGFLITYLQIFALDLQDYFNLEVNYKDVIVEVNCLTGVSHVYVDDSKPDEASYTSSQITEIVDYDNDQGHYRKVTFDDDTYVESFFDPIDVNYKDGGGGLIEDYTDHCSLKLVYTSFLVSTIAEEISYEMLKNMEDFVVVTELIEHLIDFDTSSSQTYAIKGSYVGFICNETIIGQSGDRGIVGLYEASPGNNTVTSTDVYDMNNEIEELFTIEVV